MPVGLAGHTQKSSHESLDRQRALADRIIALVDPKTALDVGCGPGLLVQALADQAVDAHGTDESEQALSGAAAEIRSRLEVRPAAKGLQDHYDVITCLGAVERMDAQTAESTLDALCGATERILFAVAPDGAADPRQVNPHPMADWAASFAERGFFRRTDVNLGFLGTPAALFERSDVQPRDLVHRYESTLVPMTAELRERRELLNRLQGDQAGAKRIAELEGQLRQASHDVLTTRDHIIGLEAESLQLHSQIGRLTSRVARLQGRLQKLQTRVSNQQRRVRRAERKLQEVKESRAWRIGRRLTRSETPEL